MHGELFERVVDRADAHQVPIEVLIELTHRCNLPCAHCYLPDHLDHGELSLPELAALFDDLAAAGTLILTLTGGEVLSRRDFRDIVDAAFERGFALKILTNATMMTDELAAHLAQRNVVEVSVSLYGGDGEVHDRVTGIPGSFARTFAGIERMLAAGLHVKLKTPMMTLNGAAAAGVHELATLRNMPCQYDMTITPKTDGGTGPLALQLQRNELVEILQRQPFAEVFGLVDGPGPQPCAAGRHYCAIGPTGEVLPCIMMHAPLGNIRRQKFADIWRDAPMLAELRALTVQSLHACGTCEVKGACTRCPGLARSRGQGIDGCDLSAREVAKARVAAARLRVIQ